MESEHTQLALKELGGDAPYWKRGVRHRFSNEMGTQSVGFQEDQLLAEAGS